MPRIVTPNVEAVPEATRPALTATQKKIGRIPDLFRVVANGPAALKGHLGLKQRPALPRGAAAGRCVSITTTPSGKSGTLDICALAILG